MNKECRLLGRGGGGGVLCVCGFFVWGEMERLCSVFKVRDKVVQTSQKTKRIKQKGW